MEWPDLFEERRDYAFYGMHGEIIRESSITRKQASQSLVSLSSTHVYLLHFTLIQAIQVISYSTVLQVECRPPQRRRRRRP